MRALRGGERERVGEPGRWLEFVRSHYTRVQGAGLPGGPSLPTGALGEFGELPSPRWGRSWSELDIRRDGAPNFRPPWERSPMSPPSPSR